MSTVQGYLTATNQPLTTISASLQTQDPYVAADADKQGRVYAVGNRSNNQIIRVDPDGTVVWSNRAELDVEVGREGVFSISKSTFGSGGTQPPDARNREITRHNFSFGTPEWRFETTDVNSDILAIAVGNQFVYGGTKTGEILKVPDINEATAPSNAIWIFSPISSAVQDMDTEGQGSVYVAFEDNTVRKVNDTPSEEWSFSGHSDAVVGVAASAFVSNVYSASKDGTVKNISGGSEDWNFQLDSPPTSLESDSAGFVYVTTEGSGSVSPAIIKIDPNGSEIDRFTRSDPFFSIALSDNVTTPINLQLDSFSEPNDEVSLSWDVYDSNTATAFNVYRSVDGGSSFNVSTSGVSGTAAVDNTDAVGTGSSVPEIIYKVTAVAGGRESPFSSTISVAYENQIQIDEAFIDSGQVTLSWSVPRDPNGEVASFDVLRSDSFFGPYTTVTNTSSQSFNESTTKDILYYQVEALDSGGNVLDTSEIQSATNAVTENFETYALGDTTTDINSRINFVGGQSWFIDDEHSRVGGQSLRSEDIGNNDSTSISIEETPSTRRQLYINWGADSENDFDEAIISKNGVEAARVSGENADSQEIFSLPAGSTTTITEDFVKDFSVSEFSDSGWMHEVIITNVLKPEASVTSANTSITVDHQPRGTDVDGDFSGFNVYIDQSKVTGTPQSRGGTFDSSTLSPGEHDVSVTNVRSDSVESFKKFYKVTVPTVTTPINLNASYDTQNVEVTLDWEANDPAIDSYNVYRSTTSGSGYTQIDSGITSKTYVDTTISQGPEYYYVVSSVSAGTESDFSNEVFVGTGIAFEDDFETDASKWTINNSAVGVVDTQSFAGSQSFGASELNGTVEWDAAFHQFDNSIQPSVVRFYWRETSNQFGAALNIHNSNGNREVAVGTENPQWTFWDGTGTDEEVFQNTANYNRWIFVELTNIDWSAGTFDYFIEDQENGNTASGTRSLQNSLDMKRIYLGTKPQTTQNPLTMWWDEIEVRF